MIRRFSCKNYKNIMVDKMELRKVNLLVGPNNAGKSNFIHAVSFLADMLRESKDSGLRSSFINTIQKNNWSHILNQGADKTSPIEFAWMMGIGDEEIEYRLHFVAGDKTEDCDIVLEEMNIEGASDEEQADKSCFFRFHETAIGKGFFSASADKENEQTWLANVSSKDSIMSRYEEILLKSVNISSNNDIRIRISGRLDFVKKYFSTFRHYSSSGFDIVKMREPFDIQNIDDYLYADASNYSGVFNHYKAKDFIWRDDFNERMRELIHDLKTADVVSEYNKHFFKMVYDGGQFDLSDVSEGTLKALVLNLLLHVPQGIRTGLLAIDEPEMNLHPAWQKVIGNWILHAEGVDQCIISTHSPDLLDVFTEGFLHGDVAVFVFDNYGSQIRNLNADTVKEELVDWTLGDLYRTSDPAIGGWPW